ncbi:MAG: DMT family transporter [Proteobacteria bacterium]|nr:DMT family transporter [Pseudomonadota bacterium]
MPVARPALGAALVLGAGVLWSLQSLSIRLTDAAPSEVIAFWRFYGQFVFLMIALILVQRGRIITSFRRAGLPAILGGICQAIASVFMVFAVVHTSTANAVFVISLSPFLAGMMAWALMGEKPTAVTWAAMGIAIAGVCVMVSGNRTDLQILGSLYALLVAFGFAGLTVMLRYGRQVEMLPTVCWGGLIGLIASFFIALARGTGDLDMPLGDALIVTLMGGSLIALGMLCFVRGARHIPAGVLALLSLSEIVLAPIWTWLFAGEAIAPREMIGAGIVLLAILGQTVATGRKRRTAEPAQP